MPGLTDPLTLGKFLIVKRAVFVDEVLVGGGRGVFLKDELGVFCSLRGKGDSLRTEAEERARGWPAGPAGPVYREGSVKKAPSRTGG